MSSTGRNLPGREVSALSAYDTPLEVCRAVVDWIREADNGETPDDFLEGAIGSGNWLRALVAAGVPASRVEVMDLDPLVPGYDLAAELGAVATHPRPTNRSPELVAEVLAELARMKVPEHRRAAVAAGFLVTEPQRRPWWSLGNPAYSVTPPGEDCPDCDGTGLRYHKRTDQLLGPCKKCMRGKNPTPGLYYPPPIAVADLHIRRSLAVTRRHVVYVLRQTHLGGLERYARLWSELGCLRAVRTIIPRPPYAHNATDSVESAVFWWDLQWDRSHYEGGWLRWHRSKGEE